MPSRPPAPLAPRGPLPPGVYWRRRLFVGLLALSIVFVIGRWLTAGGDGSSDEPATARQAGAQVEATQTVTAGAEESPTADASGGRGSRATQSASPQLAQPDGPCASADVAATPSVASGQAAGEDVTLRVSLQTLTSEACTWSVGAASLVVRISENGAQRWSTQQCRAAVPTQSVVVRRSVATVVDVVWNARESDSRCSARTRWVLPGDFTVSSAAIGGEPSSADFTLVRPGEEAPMEEPTEDATGDVDQRWESGL